MLDIEISRCFWCYLSVAAFPQPCLLQLARDFLRNGRSLGDIGDRLPPSMHFDTGHGSSDDYKSCCRAALCSTRDVSVSQLLNVPSAPVHALMIRSIETFNLYFCYHLVWHRIDNLKKREASRLCVTTWLDCLNPIICCVLDCTMVSQRPFGRWKRKSMQLGWLCMSSAARASNRYSFSPLRAER